MRYRVIEPFTTPLHRFAIDAEVDGSEIDGPVPIERWVELGKLEEVPEVAPEAATAPEPGPEDEEV